MIAVIAASLVVAGTLAIGLWGVRLARTTSDLYVASRAVSPWWNAAAISGEYLSAASFLGIAGLALKVGAPALWLPIGFTAGYLALLLFVAAPLRRFGSYTIADFAEARLSSARVRVPAMLTVLGIALLYLVPQLKGAGLTVREITGAPYWVGVVLVGGVVASAVALGGMRGITYVQAFQFWVKVFAISIPAIVLVVYLGGLPSGPSSYGSDIPRAPAAGLSVELDEPMTLTFPQATQATLDGAPLTAAAGEERTLGPGRLELPGGVAVPVADGIEVLRGEEWSYPVASEGDQSRAGSSPLYIYSLLIATFLGTMGLPHILVRFYTNPDGSAARRTTVRVLAMLGVFYLFPGVYAAIGREHLPELYVSGDTDALVLRLPEAVWPGLPGQMLGAIVAAGAFAAFMSTASGLLVSVAGTISYDLLGRARGRSAGTGAARRRRFRRVALAGLLVPGVLALLAEDLDISVLVGWAFGLAASTLCPLFVLSIWWRGLTARGAVAGLIVGAGLATIDVGLALALGERDGWLGALLLQPALVSVPAAFLTMVLVSRSGPAPDAQAMMATLHAPEGLGLRSAIRVGAAPRA